MLEDVLKVARGKTNVEFYGRMGGVMRIRMKFSARFIVLLTIPIASDAHPRDIWMERMASIV